MNLNIPGGLTTVQKINGWILAKPLGSGGFGAVHLYHNEVTGQYVAIKRCHLGDEMNDETKGRWSQECQIMLKLNHPNIVKALPVPDELSGVSSCDLPVLAMEFCEMGDLRKVLKQPQNINGLPEFQVRTIAHDIVSAIEFLHQERIIHRDLKPENIVLQNANSRVLYKLIDLGYAKDFAKDSICTSFVGTLQYLAPELILNGGNLKYTCTVDFWSLGTTVFECITGFRPFLHNFAPSAKWLEVVNNKKPSHICAYAKDRAGFEYAEKLPKPNHLCSLSQAYFEQWLRLMMLQDPARRGGEVVTKDNRKRRQCFDMLDRILNMKLIHIYSVNTNEILSYPAEIDSGGKTHPMSTETIAAMIKGTTGIDQSNQELLTLTGSIAESVKDVASYSAEEAFEKNRIDLFLFNKNSPKFSGKMRNSRVIPRQVQMILENSEKENVYEDQVKTCKYVIYLCAQIASDFNRLIEAYRAASLCLMREKSTLSAVISELKSDCNELMARIEMFDMSIQADLQELLNQKKNNGTFSQMMYNTWEQKRTKILNYTNLKDETFHLEGDCEILNTKALEVQRSPFSKECPPNCLQQFEGIARKIYEDLQNLPQGQRHKASKTKEMVDCVQDCIRESDQLMKDLYMNLSKILSYRMEMQNLKEAANKRHKDVSRIKETVFMLQKQRQEEIWKLLSIVSSQIVKTRSNVSMSTNPFNGESCLANHGTSDSIILQEESTEVRHRLDELVSMMSIRSQKHRRSSDFDWSFLQFP